MPRTVERVIDAGRDDRNACGICAVEVGDLARLNRTRREHRVGTRDDGRLGCGSLVGGICLDFFWTGFGLDSVESVKGGNER